MKTVLYSSLFPASLEYFEAFWQSIEHQEDRDFDICFALDGVNPENIQVKTLGASIHFIESKKDTPASLRQKALLELCKNYDTVVLVDSDDILLPSRIRAAKQALQSYDVYACALQLITKQGRLLKHVFTSPDISDWSSFLSQWNVFGFSNTAYRTELLVKLFPIPKETVMVDWLVISKALALNATLTFDKNVHMLYRQYENNTARVLAPYQNAQLAKSTALLLEHYEYTLKDKFIKACSSFAKQLQERQKSVKQFSKLLHDLDKLERYRAELNELKDIFLWWECVAHPDLESLWR